MYVNKGNTGNHSRNSLMIDPEKFVDFLNEAGVNFYTGVPDSLLKSFCISVSEKLPERNHMIAANEGNAVGLAIGHYLASGCVPLVYMQNSGLGNAINPLISLASPAVCGIPLLLMIGWRGMPTVKDEPQHVHQGRVTEEMLKSISIPYTILSSDVSKAQSEAQSAINLAKSGNQPVALLVAKNVFGPHKAKEVSLEKKFSREEAIIRVVSCKEKNAAIICTTGMSSRELFEYRAKTNSSHSADFLTIGGMGHASQIALGIALWQPDRTVYCLDGDGAMLMHMGSIAICGNSAASNFIHIVINNGAHESVGGQPTVGQDIDMKSIAFACGYASAVCVETGDELAEAIDIAQDVNGPAFIEVRVAVGHRINLGRPTITPAQNRSEVMEFLST